MEPLFKITVEDCYSHPQCTIYRAARRDYAEELSLYDDIEKYTLPSEKEYGEWIVRKLLPSAHYGPLEQSSFTVEVSGFPHSTIVQARTHRTGITFDVTSQRYTGKRILNLVEWGKTLGTPEEIYARYLSDHPGESVVEFVKALNKVFYTRPIGHYVDRKGVKYEQTVERQLHKLILSIYPTAINYHTAITEWGQSEEDARGILAQDIRQSFYMTLNIRTLMHILDMRYKADAQLEIQQMCELLMQFFRKYCPEIAAWYEKKRMNKNKLAP